MITDPRFAVRQGDITREPVDAIVNAVRPSLRSQLKESLFLLRGVILMSFSFFKVGFGERGYSKPSLSIPFDGGTAEDRKLLLSDKIVLAEFFPLLDAAPQGIGRREIQQKGCGREKGSEGEPEPDVARWKEGREQGENGPGGQ